MKNVLCFGDSNTYGYDPAGMRDGTAVRYAQDVRWCGVVQRDLGEGWHVIEEGLNGRTTVRDDMCHMDTNLNGIRALPMLLEAHKPLDAIVIMLGTNDSKQRLNTTAYEVGRGMERLVRKAMTVDCWGPGKKPNVLIIAPPPIGKGVETSACAEDMGKGAVETSQALAKYYAAAAELLGVHFLDASFCQFNSVDFMHLTRKGHAQLAEKLAELVPEYLEK